MFQMRPTWTSSEELLKINEFHTGEAAVIVKLAISDVLLEIAVFIKLCVVEDLYICWISIRNSKRGA